MGFTFEVNRRLLIRWTYLVTFGHLASGIFMAWGSNATAFDQYHQIILTQSGNASAAALVLQQWWLSLFGATLQNLAILMFILIYVGNKYRDASVWLWMIIGLIIWAPQDIILSLQINLWLHVWVDVIALILFIPALISLWISDRRYRLKSRFT